MMSLESFNILIHDKETGRDIKQAEAKFSETGKALNVREIFTILREGHFG